MKLVAAPVSALLAALLTGGCGSTATAPESRPATIAPADPRVAELQVQLTELLERIDVLNDRIARFEELQSVVAAAQAATPPPAARPERRAAEAPRVTPVVSEVPASAANPARVAAEGPLPQQALLAAQIADDYRQAIMLVGQGRHADARRAFESVYEADPNGDLADNALFWIGETWFTAKDYTNAVRYYNRVVSDYSDQNKAPDALFKTALAQVRTGDLALARRTLQQVVARYPYSSAASTAKAELERIRY